MRILITMFFIISILGCIPKAENQQKGFEKIAPLEENNRVVKREIELDDYSKEFSKYFIENNMILKGDSIVIPTNNRSEIVRIPTYIKRDSTIQFSSEKERSISVSQINYNEIRFAIVNGSEKVEGKASLLPHFYLGSETIGFSDGEYYITKYFATESTNQCIDYIGIGNQNIASDKSDELYAVVSMAGDTCEELLVELANKKLKRTVANNVYNP